MDSEAGPQQGGSGLRGTSSSSSTRGFLFADLRGYSNFVERYGAAEAADLLDRYRRLVREAVARFDGTEIRTEGDSFFVVFDSVSAAVRCAMEIAAAARDAPAEKPEHQIRVGIGIHAGETIETDGDYVGSVVNIAARICAQAAAGEVLVSETVRALTRTVLPVHFEPRGRPHLKGIADRLPLYAVSDVAIGSSPWFGSAGRGGRRRRNAILAASITGLVVLGAISAWYLLQRQRGLPPGDWTLAVEMPLSGQPAIRGIPIRNAVELAIADLNATASLGSANLVMSARDDLDQPDLARANAAAVVSDPSAVAMIGPWTSFAAYPVISITNQAGLFQCSPSNTLPELTKPRYGASDVRAAYPERINYVRLAPSDDILAPALASFAYNDLGGRAALVIDDTESGRDIADGFGQEFQKLGGTVIRRALNPGSDPNLVLAPLLESPATNEIVFFGGLTDTGGTDLRTAMIEDGLGSIPLLSWDGLWDGSGSEPGSYIATLGAAAAVDTYVAHSSIPDAKFAFADAYRRRFASEPDEYAAAAYACVEIVFDSLHAVAPLGPAASELREAVRAYAVDPGHRYETVLGTVGFDKNGDALQQFVTLYRVDASASGGAGDWVIYKKQDFGPAP
jgi:class 3 adenylate cyclase/ABC-type branched-subunit amino acid transport system substrate-binding protein